MGCRPPQALLALVGGLVTCVAAASCGTLLAAESDAAVADAAAVDAAATDAAEDGFDPGDPQGAGNPFDAASLPDGGKVVFVTSTGFDGYINGVAGATYWCNRLADQTPLAGRSFVALVRGNQLPGAGQWFLVNGTLAYDGTPSLDSAPLPKTAIDLDEHGAVARNKEDASSGVWTGWDNATCSKWMAGAGQPTSVKGGYGNSGTSDMAWIAAGDWPCAWPRRLYCFQIQN